MIIEISYSDVEQLDDMDIDYTEVNNPIEPKDIDTDDLINELVGRTNLCDVIMSYDFALEKEEKRNIIRQILGHNNMSYAEDMMNDFKKLFE